MELPPLDCHAHVSPSVTDHQLVQLEPAIVFAMTREPAEASLAIRRHDRNLLWGCGAHPSFVARGGEVNLDNFARCARRLPLVGEIGLDRRSGNLPRQQAVLDGILHRIREEPALISMHSAGCTGETLEILSQHPRGGVIMHWFTGSRAEAAQLVSLGCYFSVNTAMRREILEALPRNRLLPETDFPAVRKRTGARPGDTGQLETLLAEIHGGDVADVRRGFYRNLRRIATSSGAIDRFPSHLVETLLMA